MRDDAPRPQPGKSRRPAVATAPLAAALLLLGACEQHDAGVATHEPRGSVPLPAAPPPDRQQHQAGGTIAGIDRVAGELRVKHGPVPSLDLPEGTSTFAVQNAAALDELREGQSVRISFIRELQGQYVITDLVPRE
jgi:Cu(I)/Ag(I) efflux system periplasmic protein CusF